MSRLLWPRLPNLWPLVRISDLASVIYGKALTADSRIQHGSVPVYASGGLVGNHDKSLHSGPSIVIGRKGSVGSVYYIDTPFWCIDTTFYLENISEHVNAEYLYKILKAIDLKRFAIVVGVPGLNRDTLEQIQIPLPPLPEQERIVNILRQAYQLCRLRDEAIKFGKTIPENLLVSKKVKTSAFQADRFIIQDMIIRKPERSAYGLSIWKPHGI